MAAVAAVVSGCGEAPNPPIAIVQNYLNALGGGEFATACAMLDGQALQALTREKHVRMSCAQLFSRCLPHQSIALKSDQTQLLYANINVSLSDNGTVANADTSATRVATELKHVTLKHEHGVWRFTGFGQAIEACRPAGHKHKPKHSPGRHSRHKR
ncbi:MAG TPA: hypothetical protein VHW96_14265 [Solirubrobacteraceae bacterium]|nr:hypothetical protein [Solirubrobacteraceae bacterium]